MICVVTCKFGELRTNQTVTVWDIATKILLKVQNKIVLKGYFQLWKQNIMHFFCKHFHHIFLFFITVFPLITLILPR